MFNVNIYASNKTCEDPKGRSEMIPNQAKNLREILARSARGQILPEVQANALQYGDDEDPEGNDLFDPEDDKFDVRDKVSYYEIRLQQAKDAQKAAKEAKLVQLKDEANDNANEDVNVAK